MQPDLVGQFVAAVLRRDFVSNGRAFLDALHLLTQPERIEALVAIGALQPRFCPGGPRAGQLLGFEWAPSWTAYHKMGPPVSTRSYSL